MLDISLPPLSLLHLPSSTDTMAHVVTTADDALPLALYR
jgi:hypothetical protein